MTPGDFLAGNMVTRPHVVSYHDDSFDHQAEAIERVTTYCLVFVVALSGSDFPFSSYLGVSFFITLENVTILYVTW
jgi:hypothetical protein